MFAELPGTWWILIIIGLSGGIVSGALGLGSGIIFIPALVMLFSLSQKDAQGTALAVMVPMTLIGALRYWKNPEISMNPGIIILLICGAVIGVLIGTELTYRLPTPVLRKVFAVVLIIVAVRMFVTSPGRKATDSGQGPLQRKNMETTINGDTGSE